MEDKYEVALSELMKFVTMLNYDVENLEYRKFDINQKIENTASQSMIRAEKENVR